MIEPRLRPYSKLLEIGSGTGQHAVYFAPGLPWLHWQTSDRRENHAAIRAWLAEAEGGDIAPPLALDVLSDAWPPGPYDAVFSANTAHIMPPPAVEAMFRGVGSVLVAGGRFFLYGPFSYDGEHTAASNTEFDAWLRHRNPSMGVRDVAWLRDLACAAGMALDEDLAMPADNRILVWLKQ